MKVLILFLDGVGLGDDSAEVNPFVRYAPPFLSHLLGGARLIRANAGHHSKKLTLRGLDVGLGVAGLAQSGTGQAAILSGLNVPQMLGGHDGPYPSTAVKQILDQHNLFSQLQAQGKRVAYAHAFPPNYHARLGRGKARMSANAYALHTAGVRLRTLDDLRTGRAVSGDITNGYWFKNQADMPTLTPQQAGQNLVLLAQAYDVSYFDLWTTDVVGHRRNWDDAEALLGLLDGFLAGIVDSLPPEMLFLIISDHGNFEDLSTKQHTPNPALFMALGPAHPQIAATAQTMTSVLDIAPLVQRVLGVGR